VFGPTSTNTDLEGVASDHGAVRDILIPVTRDPNVPSLGRALLLALLLLVGAAIILGALGLILLTQLPENFF
jgi:hypothetical protein